VYAR
jgi:hypothetical protein